MNTYKSLNKQTFSKNEYSIVPIRYEDRYDIMKWRNEQVYHLRQIKPLTKGEQDKYFDKIIAGLFDQKQPSQILFSFLKGDKCIGYGGLVHINWVDKNMEISFIMDTSLETNYFEKYWLIYLELIERVAFGDLGFHKIYTYAFDLRPHIYDIFEKAGLKIETVLEEHVKVRNKFLSIVIHSKINSYE